MKEREDILDESEIKKLKGQSIVYRTSKGKKHKVTPSFLELYGSMIESSSSEEEEEARKAYYGHLKYARAYLVSKTRVA